jgi:hypothetical protein
MLQYGEQASEIQRRMWFIYLWERLHAKDMTQLDIEG